MAAIFADSKSSNESLRKCGRQSISNQYRSKKKRSLSRIHLGIYFLMAQ